MSYHSTSSMSDTEDCISQPATTDIGWVYSRVDSRNLNVVLRANDAPKNVDWTPWDNIP